MELLCQAVDALAEKPAPETFVPDPARSCEEQIFEMGVFHARQEEEAPVQPPKVAWKKVAEYISEHGGSYQFGNATCKKKWCEINGVQT